LDIICRDSASEIQVSSRESLTVGMLERKNTEDDKEVAGMLYQNVITFSTE
jgi:hypothetical protein